MDIDQDGKPDIISGSWPGELFVFKGKGKGRFAEPVKLNGRNGKPIKLDKASTVFACDWRGTGRLDLLVGSLKGLVYLVPDTAKKGPPKYGKAIQLTANGKEILAPGGDSHPIAADWEGSGKPGLIVGCGDGSVLWFRNTGRPGEPKLARPKTLVGAAPRPDSNGRPPTKKAQPGMRAKVCAVDWDGDGELELLVGDVGWTRARQPRLTEDQEKLRNQTMSRMEEIMAPIRPFMEKMSAKLSKITDPAKRDAAVEKLNAEYTKRFSAERSELIALSQTLRPLQASMETHGRVWLYRRNGGELNGGKRKA